MRREQYMAIRGNVVHEIRTLIYAHAISGRISIGLISISTIPLVTILASRDLPMSLNIRYASNTIRHLRPIRPITAIRATLHPSPRRNYARMLSSPPQAEYTFGLSWQILTPLLLLGTGSIGMIIWYFSSNEFLDAGFPPRAAEAFRIASIAASDWQLPHSIRYWRFGLEIALASGMSPFDERILKIKGRLMETIKREGDVGAEREVLEEIREQALQEIRSGTSNERGKLVALIVQSSISLANVFSLWLWLI
jgi:hypothetical protein